MNTFTPKKKNSFADEIRNYLLEGYIIRRDYRDETPLEVIGRGRIPNLPTMRNIGSEDDIVEQRIHCSHTLFDEVIDELSKEYSVREIWCSWSGACQYSTYGYYIDGE